MPSKFTIGLVDYDGDRQQTSFEGITQTAANFDAQATEYGALRTAIEAVTLGATYLVANTAVESVFTVSNPTDPFAQVNIQWIVEYVDVTTGGTYTQRIGTADLDLADAIYNGAPALNVGSGGAGNALAVAFEAFVRHNGNAVEVVAIYFRE